MTSDLNLDAALKILRDAGHQIGDAHIPPAPHGDAMRIWIDGIPCTLRGVLKMAEEEIEAKDEEKPEQPLAGASESVPPSSHRTLISS
jgi:hypothetical protein